MSTAATPSTGNNAVPEYSHDADGYCPFFQHAIEVIGRRWTGSILRSLMAGERRFSEIRESIPGLSDRLLNSGLGELQDEQIVERSESDGLPYRLTEKVLALGPLFDAFGSWAATFDCAPDKPGRLRQASEELAPGDS